MNRRIDIAVGCQATAKSDVGLLQMIQINAVGFLIRIVPEYNASPVTIVRPVRHTIVVSADSIVAVRRKDHVV